ncbi:carbon monoxide dehydrogenase maturation protein [Plectonema cf. radiosum LEGE 06105]|uniref:Carbon monoxide dehydrogenase maturation protein n=1 Tax=Plectonema cf. radiosum LEGE 06105 TaxID=945769 RepID=A0A8J7F0A4_9CYAN|nr:carbon monoxide dehydrogenase maturation protein [Plectonema radiosum]MBE9213373.1 carbon monoxide dehydrogenase maturation protein [Plectonema cf. radiosum LEGE 06105]
MTINTVNASFDNELVIALMGKGGTGKTFTSLGLIQGLRKLDREMIVADADTNRSLSRYLAAHYLGYGEEQLKQLPLITQAEQDFYDYHQLDSEQTYREFYGTPFERVQKFSVEPPDYFTQKYTKSLDDKLALMSVGTSAMRMEELYSTRCSHATLNPLKAWLALSTNGIVVLDCGGGEDSGRFGLPIGANVVVVVVEATPDAIAISEDIRAIDEELGIPVVYVLNKCLNQFPQVEAFEAEHQDTIVGKIPFIPSIYGKNPLEVFDEIEPIFTPMVEKILTQKLSSPQQRWERVLRWQERLQQQREMAKSQPFSFIS